MKEKLVYVLLIAITIPIFLFLVNYKDLHWGGDIIEYYGITESFLNHASPQLTAKDQSRISSVLNPEYFKDPGWYIEGRDNKKYPVHFFFYSLLALPARVLLQLFHGNPLDALRLTNLFILTATVFIVLFYFLKNIFQKYVFLLTVYLSPFVWFLIWPGPDVYYMSLLLLSLFLFARKKYLLAAFLTTLASWQSQPLIFISYCFTAFYLYTESIHKDVLHKRHLKLKLSVILFAGGITFLTLLPYVYNYLAFGVLSPWSILKDSWTQLFGFGFHNIRLGKTVELLFDLNMGLFWYIPVLFVVGFYVLLKGVRKQNQDTSFAPSTHTSFISRLFHKLHVTSYKTNHLYLAILVLLFVTSLLYQTNPAFHYGTSGLGPTRHALYIVPFLIYFFVGYIKPTFKHAVVLTLFILTQAYVLSFNGGLAPNFLYVLEHSPYSKYILNNYPELYNPTPEIFVDRTNHTDSILSFAVYKDNSVCKKAYVLKTDLQKLLDACGFVPDKYLPLFDTTSQIPNQYPRTIHAIEATLWPDPRTCEKDAVPGFYCLRTLQDTVQYTHVKDQKRLTKVEGYEGVWHVAFGPILELIIPSGYLATYYPGQGFYVTY